jgi:enoyl-CoA hydratase/carnithine racemase
MSDLILKELSAEGILTLTMNMPELHNPVSEPAMIKALVSEMEAADADINVRVVILTGAGKSFSSGGNIHSMKPGGDINRGTAALTRRGYKDGIQQLPLLFEGLEVPVIAAVNGAAIGAGCDLTCMCDIRIASEHARFAESFVNLGIVPGDGGAWLVPRIVGFAKAVEMAFTGDMLNAEEALACGLVSRVVPADQLLDTAMEIARKIASKPPHAVRMTKRLLREGYQTSLKNILETSAAYQAIAHTTSDHDEAVAAFLEKRKPVFTGK